MALFACGDITVCIADSCMASASSRLCRSQGIVAVQGAQVADGYAPGAFLPREPFDAETETLMPATSGAARMSRPQTIGVLPISAGLLQRLRQAAVVAREGTPLDRCIDAICTEIAPFWQISAAPQRLTVGHNPPGLRTVTRDPITAQFVGLHVDTFHDRYDSARVAAGNRLSINIGREPRHLLFVARAFRHLRGAVAQEEWQETRQEARQDVVAAFLAANGEQPVMRLRIDPGEAYIAPTESLIHDATSLGMTAADVHVTARAIFDPLPP